MESLKIVVLNRALNAIQNTYDWYRINLSISAANHFREGIYNTIETLSKMPSIGRKDDSYKGKQEYYSFLSHPKYRIVYRYTDTTLYIVAIRATMMSL